MTAASPAQPPTEGERWTLAELARLRADRWRPRDWIEFVWAAQVRANVTRRRRTGLARQEAIWITVGGVAWLVAGRLPAASSLARAWRRGGGLVGGMCGDARLAPGHARDT